MERKNSRIVFSGGGTGGHLYPALAVADELRRRHPDASITFVGARRGLERRLVPAAGYPLVSLGLSGLKGAGWAGKLRGGASAGWAVLRCLGWMLRRRPDLVVGVGGYASGPGVLAGKLLKVSTMILEQNHFPGATNRWLAPRVDAVCLPSDAARERIGGRRFVTGNPVRREFFEIGELPGADRLCLLVFGGSRGARAINRAMTDALDALAAMKPQPHVVHQTGEHDVEDVRESYKKSGLESHEVLPFLDNMGARLAAAELVVCRAGASTVAELCAAGRPGILVPYPYAADDHQRHNAEALRRSGAAVLLLEKELNGETLAGSIRNLAADGERRRAMGRAARALAMPEATRRIADIADLLLEGRRPNEDPHVS